MACLFPDTLLSLSKGTRRLMKPVMHVDYLLYPSVQVDLLLTQGSSLHLLALANLVYHLQIPVSIVRVSCQYFLLY